MDETNEFEFYQIELDDITVDKLNAIFEATGAIWDKVIRACIARVYYELKEIGLIQESEDF